MKKLYSIVLMAAALLVSTTASAATVAKIGTTEYETFEAAWKAVKTGETIQLQANITIGTTLWLGTTTMADENPLSITLDLNGDTLTSTAQKVFVLTHGSLNVTGNGGIKHAPTGTIYSGGEYQSKFEIFRVYGSTYKDIDAKTSDTYYTHLTIGAGVKLVAAVNGIVVDKFSSWDIASAWAAGNKNIPTADADKLALYTDVYSKGNGVAHGVCIDVKGTIEARKYAIKANGNLRTPAWSADNSGKKIGQESYRATQYSDRNSTRYVIAADDEKNYSPFIHVYSTAKLLTTETLRTDAVAAYGGGYARWLVEGAVEGSTAVYVKSGEIELKNAQITSNFDGVASGSTADRGSGVDAGGSGIVIESSANYAGGTDITIEGNTVVTPTSGFAIEEKITNAADTTKVDNVDIKGGTFKEGDAGTIVVTTQTTSGNNVVSIDGGTFEYANETGGGIDLGGKSLEQFLVDQAGSGDNTHTVVVATDDQGHQTIVISEGDKPAVANSVIGAAENASINWKNDGTTTETLTSNKKLAELQISQDYNQTLIVPDGLTLEVGRVVLGAKAQIVVKAGGKFIVTGEQGLAAFQERNLVLEASESKQAIFLFNPAVTSNTHPMATVEFLSKSYVDGSNWARQCFGIPTYQAMTSIDAVDKDDYSVKVRTKFGRYSYAIHDWEVIGEINSTNPAVNLNDMADPFNYYQMINYGTVMNNTKVIMNGSLVGNIIPQLNVRANAWNGYANSCTAPMNINVLLSEIPNSVQKAIYLLDITAQQTTWIPRTNLNEDEPNMQNIAPLQPFLICNELAAANVNVSYEYAVYNPNMGIGNPAPARRLANYMTKAKMVVKGEGCVDRVIVAEDDEFSAEFDNGYDAVKYMNDGVNMYITADKKMSIFATDDLNNTYVGLQTVKGGNYTIEFANVQGEELFLIDHETGAQVAMVEGATYEFTADANSANDYRFEVVSPRKVTTAIENAEAVKSAKGIYTITGQYVGEMNVWNTLPAGIYVVNGEKRVK